jgi:hypothetical protein
MVFTEGRTLGNGFKSQLELQNLDEYSVSQDEVSWAREVPNEVYSHPLMGLILTLRDGMSRRNRWDRQAVDC